MCVRMCVCVWCPDLRGERERQKHIRLEGNEKDEKESARVSQGERRGTREITSLREKTEYEKSGKVG